jgi:hypothetical protein
MKYLPSSHLLYFVLQLIWVVPVTSLWVKQYLGGFDPLKIGARWQVPNFALIIKRS